MRNHNKFCTEKYREHRPYEGGPVPGREVWKDSLKDK